MQMNRIIWGESNTPTIRFRAVGDINFSRGISKQLKEHKNYTPLPELTSELGEAPLAFFNLECNPVITENPAYATSTMLAPTFFLPQIRKEFNIACIANNHSTDAGFEAFLETISYLHAEKFTIVGGGKNSQEAEAIRTIDIQGVRIGILACADFVYGPHWQGNHAGPSKAGISIYQPKKLIHTICRHKQQVDIMICSIHTGLEFHHYPDPQLIQNARSMIHAGAHIILIHHAHVRQGIERYEHGLIAYGLGNFIFDVKHPYMQQQGISTDIGIIIDIYLHKHGILGYDFWLSQIGADLKTKILLDVDTHSALYQEQINFNQHLSEPLFIQQEWKKVCKKYLKTSYYGLYWAIRKKDFLRFFHLLRNLTRRENRRWIMGLLGF